MNDTIIQILLHYQLPAIFFGAFFFGETVIISAAFLAGQGIWSVWNVFWLSLIGTVLSDAAWFLFGQSIFSITGRWKKITTTHDKIIGKLEKITNNKPFYSLLFIKFLYGTRILFILYLSIRKISLLTFVLFDTIGTILWLTVMIFIGWLAGKGIADATQIVHKTEFALLVLVILVVSYKLITLWIEKKLEK